VPTDLGLDYLSPTAPLGMLILFIGIVFSIGIFYILLNLDKDSISDRQRKESIEKIRQEKLDSLYPKR
tara:strand:- start:455 stop:658 length:204 start_codon:yes stop_codon:yes gene_type:complete